MSKDAAQYLHPFVVYRTAPGEEDVRRIVAMVVARDAEHAIEQIEMRFPRSKLSLVGVMRGAGSGHFDAVSAYEVSDQDLTRAATIVQTDVALINMQNLGQLNMAMQQILGLIQAGAALAQQGKH